MKDPFKTRKMQHGRRCRRTPEAGSRRAASSGGSGRRAPLRRRRPTPAGTPANRGGAHDRSGHGRSLASRPSGKDRATLTVLQRHQRRAGLRARRHRARHRARHRGRYLGRGRRRQPSPRAHHVPLGRPLLHRGSRLDERHLPRQPSASTSRSFVRRSHPVGPHVTLRFQITDDAEEELQRRLYESSTRDALTRVYNRKYFTERLTAEVAYSRRHRVKLAVLHPRSRRLQGDERHVRPPRRRHGASPGLARRCSASSASRICSRATAARSSSSSRGRPEKPRRAPRRPHSRVDQRARDSGRAAIARSGVTVSIGVAALPDVAPDGGPNELLALADARLYRAKAEGKNRVCAEGEQ